MNVSRRSLLMGSASGAALAAIGGVSFRSRGVQALQDSGAGTIITSLSAEPPGFDPCNPWNLGSGFQGLMQLPYETWTRFDRELQLQPHLVSDWERVDESTINFTLRKGITFHGSGREMTTADVTRTIERFTNPELACAGSGTYDTLVESITAIDEYTFQVKVTQPNLLPQRVPLPRMADPDFVDANADPLLLFEEAGTGPWLLDEWKTQSHISFVRNPAYWGTVPKLEGFRFQIIPEETSAVAALQAGQLNYLPFSSLDSYQLLDGNPGITVYSSPSFQYRRINVNHLRPKLQDPNVLQALRYGINRQQIVDTLSLGLGQVSGPISPSVQTYALPNDEMLELQKYDPDLAKEFLAKSGFDTEDNRLNLVCLSIANFQNFTDVAQIVAANLAEIGIDLEIRIQEIGVYVDSRTKTGDYDLGINNYEINADPDFTFYRSDQVEQEWTGGGDAALDEAINAANSEEDYETRREHVLRIQRLLIENVREIYLYAPPYFEAVSNEVQGYTPFPGGNNLTVFANDGVTLAG